MNFNPNTIMKQKIQQMISQRFGSVDNMMNDMSKFAGNKYSKMYLMKNTYHQMELYRNSLDYNTSP